MKRGRFSNTRCSTLCRNKDYTVQWREDGAKELSEGLIYYRTPKTLRKYKLKLQHETHLDYYKIYKIPRELFYWPLITSELKKITGQYKKCIR